MIAEKKMSSGEICKIILKTQMFYYFKTKYNFKIKEKLKTLLNKTLP